MIVGLLAGSVVLGAAFAVSQRRGRSPMLVPALTANRQFMGASAAFILFGIGVMGTLFLAVLAFVNLWHYSEIDAALAITPIAVLGDDRLAARRPPRRPLLAALDGGPGADHDGRRAVLARGRVHRRAATTCASFPGLVLVGIGMGAMFPAVNVGAMGSIGGQELGVGSGIVNMSRQLGFALGVAILVAVFNGVVGDSTDPAAARDGFVAGFRVAGLAVLLAIPFALTMRRRPGEAQRPAAVDVEVPASV